MPPSTAEVQEESGTMYVEDVGVCRKVSDRFYWSDKTATLPFVTMEEVGRHTTEDDLWLVVRDIVYNMSGWGYEHPGGRLPLLHLAGRDATDAFEAYHPGKEWHRLKQFEVARVKRTTPTQNDTVLRAFRELRQDLMAKGMYKTDVTFYYKLVAWFAVLYASVWAAVLSGYDFVGALLLGMFFQQVAFFGHDLGHSAVAHVMKYDEALGLFFGNFASGISMAWWKRTHNVHHLVTNSIDYDPDIQHLPIFAISSKIWRLTGGRFYSHYHKRDFVVDAATKMLVKFQDKLFYLVMGLARLNLYLQSWILILKSPRETRHFGMEVVTLLGFIAWMSVLVSYTSSPFMFLFVSHFLAGVTLNAQITLSHFAMDAFLGRPFDKNNDEDGWVNVHLEGSLNIECPPWMDWFHGGLQFQVEHHLLPRIPRHNLRATNAILKAFCAKHGVKHYEMPFVRANLYMLKQLKRAADDMRSDCLADALNMNG